MPLEIAKMLVLSTGHLTEHTCDTWLPEAARQASFYHKPEGWFIYAGAEHQLEDMPPDLYACIDFAKQHDCLWIMFDCDGDTVGELPVFDW